ncbi:methyltransferase domain-containing protein [Hyphomicrobium zavarzinii]|uniref:methyltransferase domain-containing protein n=1 Tax=Hyphomicrobium zavarzinii TaxID=48292 RepID=UPI0003A83BF8|nr:methyltransferase domain-containing protein [Hyphomicrobium zavarzinii]
MIEMNNKGLYDSVEIWEQEMQPGQRNLLRALLDIWPSGCKTVLDVGCGDGKISGPLSGYTGADFTGVDIAGEALARLPFRGLEASADALPFADGTFDLVMTTDSLEHLPDEVERGAWQEIFRTARQWVIVAVPFREELLDGLSSCHTCKCEYHVNWHQRRYDIDDLALRAPEGWEPAFAVLSGEAWSPTLPYETHVRRRIFNQYNGWDKSVCPNCGARGQTPSPAPALPPSLANALGCYTYNALRTHRIARSHSEVVVAFCRTGTPAATPSLETAVTQIRAATEVYVPEAPESADLVSFPQVARRVVRSGGDFVAQFPLYDRTSPLIVRRTEGSSDAVALTVTDGVGQAFNGLALSPGEIEAEVTFNRPLIAGTFGIIVEAKGAPPIARLKLGDGPTITWVSPKADGAFAYHTINTGALAVHVQIRDSDWLDESIFPVEAPINYPSPAELFVLQNETDEVQSNAINTLTADLEVMRAGAERAEHLAVDLQNVSAERDALLVRASEADRLAVEVQNLDAERNFLLKRASDADRLAVDVQNLRAERDALSARAAEAEKLDVETQNLRTERDALAARAAEAEQLSVKVQNLAADRDALAKRSNEAEKLAVETQNLRAERDALAARAAEAEQLSVKVQNLAADRDALAKRSNEAEKLAVETQNLRAERDALAARAAEAERLAADVQYLLEERDHFKDRAGEADRLASMSESLSAENASLRELLTLRPQETNAPRVLMLCHDQHLDRRVSAQAHSLIASGCHVTLMMLAFGPEGSSETDAAGLEIVRIGLAGIIPENPTYVRYMARQNSYNDALNRRANKNQKLLKLWNLGFRTSSNINRYRYLTGLYIRYRNRFMHDPLPFRSAFYNAAKGLSFDLLQVHDLPALEAGVQLAEEHNVPLVYDAHELYPEQASFSREQRRICSETEARLITRAQLVIAVNDSIGEEMARRYHIRKPVTLWNALTPDASFDITARHDRLRQKLGLAQSRRILLFQGGYSPNRNLERLVDAMAHVKTGDVDLVLLGFGGFERVLRQHAERLGLLGKRVHFLKAVDQNELLQHSASADLGIIPYPHVDMNSYFCTPNKLFEFIQAGLPILANSSPELIRFVKGNGFGHVAPMTSAEAIAEAIDAAFSHSDYARWRNNLVAGRDRFTWNQQEERYLKAIWPHLKYRLPQRSGAVHPDAS